MEHIYAVVYEGVVINIVVWDGVSEWQPDKGEAILTDGSVGMGFLYDGKVFTPPPEIMQESTEQ